MSAALDYATYMQDVLGLQVVPLWGPTFGPAGGRCTCRAGASCESPCKHPRGRYKDQPSRLPAGSDNYAVVLGRYVVVDVDDRSVLDTLGDTLGFALPDTWAVDTGRGRHYWFLAEAPLRTRIGAWHKVDVKSGPTYVVGAGSVSVNGTVYEPINTLPIAPCPPALVQHCAYAGRPMAPVIHALPSVTNRFAWQALEPKLEAMRSATERNNTLHRTACEMMRSGIYGTDAIAALAAAAIDAGLTEYEVRRTIDSARRAVVAG